ncbi:hypothetical protein MASR2M64_00800 [Candidatus Cloacimonadota bacterium]
MKEIIESIRKTLIKMNNQGKKTIPTVKTAFDTFVNNQYNLYSIPVYKILQSEEPEKVASCFILKYKDEAFLITAKHVYFDSLKREKVTQEPYFMYGLMQESLPVVEDNHIRPIKDNADFIIIILTSHQVSQILGNRFKPIEEAQYDPHFFRLKQSFYFCCGYPNDINEPDFSSHQFIYKHFIVFSKTAQKKTKTKCKLTPLFTNDSKDLNTIEESSIDFHGMSGCPIWQIIQQKQGYSFMLKGLLIEYENKVITGEWLCYITKCIEEKFFKGD